MAVDGVIQETPSRSSITLGGAREVHCVTGAVNRSVQVLPLARHFDVGLIYAPV